MLKRTTLLAFGILSFFQLIAQFEIDTTLHVIEKYEKEMPRVHDQNLYVAMETLDSTGNVIEKHFFQKWNGGTANWMVNYEYNTLNQLIKIWNTDTLGTMVRAVVCDAPMTKNKYNSEGLLVEKAYFSDEETPTFHDCSYNHKEITRYDENGRVVFEQSVSLTGDIMGTIKYVLDDKGRVSEIHLLDEKEGLITERPSIITIAYDEEDREIKNSFYDFKRRPVSGEREMSYRTYEHIEGGRIIRDFNSNGENIKTVKRVGNIQTILN